MLKHQHAAFHKLLTHVWRHSAFYRDYYNGHGINEEHLAEVGIQDLPFVTKQTLMENFDQAVTDPRLKKKELEQWILEVRNPGELYCDQFIVLHTSGSSGAIAIFAYDLNGWRLMNATVTKNLPPPEMGFHGRTRVATYLASHGHFAGVTSAALLPRTVWDVFVASVLEATERVVKQLNEFQPHRITGYPSSVAMLADLALRGTLCIHPLTVLVGGEVLTESMKEKIQSAWRVPIYELYSASESMFLAIRTPGEEDLIVVNDLNVLEVLGADHRTVASGESGRIVLTNLYNYVLPILRYELGDYAIRGQDGFDTSITRIRSIQGRVNDALPVMLDNGKADSIHPIILSEFYAAGLQNVQFISRCLDHVEIHYVAPENINASVAREFHRILELKGARRRTRFECRRVEQIANDPRTGKFAIVKIENICASEVRDTAPTSSGMDGIIKVRRDDPEIPVVRFEKEDIEQSISARFEQQVAKYSERIAIRSKACQLTYSELNAFANRIARAILARRGEGTEPVAIVLADDAPKVAAILGILKAGKIYIPIEPTLPLPVLGSILEDSKASSIITDNSTLSLGRQLLKEDVQVINIDTLDPTLRSENLDLRIAPEHLAYILYTSGSTGKPKGVFQNHRNVLRKIMIYTNSSHIGFEDRFSLVTPFGFSAVLQSLFGALLNGAALYPWRIKDEGIGNLIELLLTEEITVCRAAATVFRHFVDTLAEDKKIPQLRLIDLFAEPVSAADIERYRKHVSPHCIIRNHFASTEAGIVAEYRIRSDTRLTPGVVPVGYAVGGAKVWLLDEQKREVGFNITGEIAVKTADLALGYWRDPELTQTAFIPDPRGGSEPIFLTGDLGRMQSDGCLIHLGRKDSRVKIRGHTVELAMVELALLEHAAVKEAVVVAQDDFRHEKRLVAYVASNQEDAVKTRELRLFLEQKLPSHTVPSIFVLLDALPLLPNGKVDRQSLPRASHERDDDQEPVAPRTPLERQLAEIWCEVLGLERVCIYDNFFDLGGDSLSATQVVSRVRDIFQVHVPIHTLLARPRVAEMAISIVKAQTERVNAAELDRVMSKLEEISDHDARTMLAEKNGMAIGDKVK